MTARTVSARDLETLARAAHADIELPGPEGGWATAVINGREYRARVAPAACPVCGGKGSHHRACPQTAIGIEWCKCSPAEVEDGFCVLCGNPFRVGGAV